MASITKTIAHLLTPASIAVLVCCTTIDEPPREAKPEPRVHPDVKALCLVDGGRFAGRRGEGGNRYRTISCGDDLVVPCEAGSVELPDGTWTCACDPDYLDGQADCADAVGFVRHFRPSVQIEGRCVDGRCEWSR